jgi:hypothetical protein
VKVPPSEDLASHTVLESCVVHREVRREALIEVRVGQPLSRERSKVQGADAVIEVEGNMDRCDSASACLALRGLRPWHARMLLAREPGDLPLDHRNIVARIGKVRSRSR